MTKNSIDTSVNSSEIRHLTSSTAYLDTDSKSYSLAREQHGIFPILVEKVEPYLDGYKVTVEIGNLTAASLSGAKVTLSWGPDGYDSSKEFEIATEFLPGRYTRVELIAAPAKATDVKKVGVGLEFEGLKLGVPAND